MKFHLFGVFKNKQTTLEFLKSIVVGWASNAVDFLLTAIFLYAYGNEHYAGFWGVFSGATKDGIPYSPSVSVYITATVIGFVASVAVNYILSSVFVYKYGNVGKTKRGFAKFMIFSAIGLGLTSFGSWIGYDVIGGNMWLVKLIVQLIVFVYNFITRRLFIFNVDLIRDDENTINL
ncbi:MAG: GtrA family protein [Clostridiales bacterium]|nr:GtrA family protein [Clostridiales bacterium]